MDATLRTRYREMREKYPQVGASAALAWARTPDPEPLDWNDSGDRAELHRDGFTITVKIEPDDIGAREFCTFTDDAPDKHEELYRNPRAWSDGERAGRDHYAYCIPVSTSFEDVYAELRRSGVARGPADEQARAQVRSMVELYCSDDYAMYVVLVKASRAGIDLGYSSVGGVDVDPRASYIEARREFERVIAEGDLIGEAISDARDSLRDLCESE